jgi:hypothetical protein
MTTGRNTTDDLALLARTLETFGGDEARWPDRVRTRCEAAARSVEGARLVKEARALDLVLGGLETKSFGDPAVVAPLADRIMARITTETANTVAPVSPGRVGTVVTMPSPAARSAVAPRSQQSSRWLPAAAVAASLVLGISIGAGTSIGGAVGDLAEALGLATDLGSVTLAYNDDAGGFDEDTP